MDENVDDGINKERYIVQNCHDDRQNCLTQIIGDNWKQEEINQLWNHNQEDKSCNQKT